MRTLRAPIIALAACGALALAAGPAGALQITEVTLPQTGTGLQQIARGPDGNMWFTEAVRSQFGRITPALKLADFSSGCGITTGAFPVGITAGADGGVWFAEGQFDHVARANPANCSVDEHSAGITSGADPLAITAGPDGNVWFTESTGLGRITPAGLVMEFPATAGWKPSGGVVAGPDGQLWFTEFQQAQGGAIARMTTGGVVSFVGTGIARSGGVPAIGSDGDVWVAEFDRVARATPTGDVTEFPIPPQAHPSSLTLGPDGDLWFDEAGVQRLGSISPSGQYAGHAAAFTGGHGAVSVAAGPGRQLWALDGSGDAVARVRLDPAATTGDVSFPAAAVQVAGSVDPFASATSYQFQYGTTTAYGRATASVTIPPGPGPVTVAAPLAGLSGNALYHYRLVATSEAGTAVGADRTLATFGLPGTPAGGSGAADRTAPRMRVTLRGLTLGRDGRVAVALRCPLTEPSGCRGTVRLTTARAYRLGATRRVVRLGSAPFRVRGGHAATVSLRVPAAGRTLVARLRSLRARVAIRASDAAGNTATTTRDLPLRAAGRRHP